MFKLNIVFNCGVSFWSNSFNFCQISVSCCLNDTRQNKSKCLDNFLKTRWVAPLITDPHLLALPLFSFFKKKLSWILSLILGLWFFFIYFFYLQKKSDTWHLTPDMWHATCDRWQVTHDTRHVTRNTQGLWTLSQKLGP